ncbi:MAG: nicotinate phosphoribosyltransferase [Gammaproteobacteria bacterium]|nr:nicotinate phosphoribosyltransferase [Gammaproteobacteria bacterium]
MPSRQNSYNLLLDTDSYKLTHWRQYPPGTEHVSAYIESRGGAPHEIVFFGLQAFLLDALCQPVQPWQIEETEALARAHLGRDDCFNRAGWEHILQRHGGRLPVSIEALPEGSVVGHRVPVLQVVNTDPACAWLTCYLETALLRAVWYPSTVASLSFACKRVLRRYLEETADSTAALDLQLHDFGARGATCEPAAAIGGAAHLLNFRGTDTLPALRLAQRCYGEPLAGVSIPAAEHSTITAWTRDGEVAAYRNLIRQFGGPGRTLAFVVDSYDLWHAIDHLLGEQLKREIEACGGRVAIRPDSGRPTAVVPEVVERLMRHFGHRVNGKGFRVLPDYLRVIQGDGVTPESLPQILAALKARGLSTENCTFGMGGGLLQRLDRDTLQWAMKASWLQIDGRPCDIAKTPVTDPGKASRAGRWAVTGEPGAYRAAAATQLGPQRNFLRPVFRNGRLLIRENFDLLRQRLRLHFESAEAGAG